MRNSTTEGRAAQTERDEIESILATRIRALNATIEDADPDSIDEHYLHLRQLRELGHLAGQYRMLLKDTDIDELQDDMELLKESRDVMEDRR